MDDGSTDRGNRGPARPRRQALLARSGLSLFGAVLQGIQLKKSWRRVVKVTSQVLFPNGLRGNSLHQGAVNLFELAGKHQGRAGSRITGGGKCVTESLKAEQAGLLVSVGWQRRVNQKLGGQRSRLPALLDGGDDLGRQQGKGVLKKRSLTLSV